MSADKYPSIFSRQMKAIGTVRELKHATFSSHGRQPEVDISHARTVVLDFQTDRISSKKRLNNINVIFVFENSALEKNESS